MYCTNCGIPRIRETIYCHNCGRSFAASLADAPLADNATNELDQQVNPGRVPWRGGQVALGILLVAVLIIPVTAISIVIGRGVERYDEAAAIWSSVHLIGLAILLVVWRLGVYRNRASISTLGLLPWRIPQAKTVFMTVGTLVASLVITVVYGTLVDLIDADILSPPDLSSDIAFPGAAAVFTFEALAVATPLTEEIFFRGFVFAGLAPRLGVGWAMVVSAVVFSLFHLSVGVLVPVFITGLLLVWLYQQTGSLWPSICAHAGQNALAVAIEIYGV